MNEPLARVDAHEKVTGAARFGADRVPANLAHAVFAVATIARGTVVRVDTEAAEAVAGVRLVLTQVTSTRPCPPGWWMDGTGFAVQSLHPLLEDTIAYRGQPIAMIVADTLYAAAEAAALVTAEYKTECASVELDAIGAEAVDQESAIPLPMFADIRVGDADSVYATAPVRIDASYDCPPQHQVPMELIGCVVSWEGDHLIVYAGTRSANALRLALAGQFQLDPGMVRAISSYAGGAFGNGNSLPVQTGLAALAARQLGRPVKFVQSRLVQFHNDSFRPASRHHLRLGADRSGRLVAAIHEVDSQTSRNDLIPVSYTDVTSRMYGIAHFRGHQRGIRTDVQTPGYLRAPYEHPASFALESAIDELAYAVRQDPVQLRLANDTDRDPITGNPFIARRLAECLRRGADRFGWGQRTSEPGSMKDTDGTLIGWGVAAGSYQAAAPCVVRRHVGYVAHFVEVRVEPTTRRVRVARVVSVADCGRVASPVTAASQLRGGVIWGIGASLREVSEVDPRYGGFLNADLADYVVAVMADIPDITVDFINEPDTQSNPLGLKGFGEVPIVGVAAAVANAVYHATGRRHRRIPIRIEDVL